MAFFVKKTWKDRLVQYPNRRVLTDVSTGTTQTVTVARSEGEVDEAGDGFTETNMNNLETRIDNAFTGVSTRFNTSDVNVAPLFDAEKVGGYVVNDRVIKDGVLYKCIATHTGAWESAHFSQTDIDTELGSAGGGATVDLIDEYVTVNSSNWSLTPNIDGFYTYNFYITKNSKKIRLKNSYVPIFALAGATSSTLPTEAEQDEYLLIDNLAYVDEIITENGETYTATKFTLSAKTKPALTFYIIVKAQEYPTS